MTYDDARWVEKVAKAAAIIGLLVAVGLVGAFWYIASRWVVR